MSTPNPISKSSQTVRIEQHEFADKFIALTYADPKVVSNADHLPLVLVLHGLGSRKERHLDLCLRLAKAGFLACAIDVRYHGDRRADEAKALFGDRTSLEFAILFSKAVRGTVEDIMQVASYFGSEKYGLIGHSMGGFIAVHAALTDRRAIAVANVAGSIDVRPPAHAALPPELIALSTAADPSSHAAALPPCALLILHGEEDATVSVSGARRFYEAAQSAYQTQPERLKLDIMPEVGHDWTVEFADRSVEWMLQWAAELD